MLPLPYYPTKADGISGGTGQPGFRGLGLHLRFLVWWFWLLDFAFVFLSLAQRAFAAALIFALAAAESLRRFRGLAPFSAGRAGC
jgi:hypothetical protein